MFKKKLCKHEYKYFNKYSAPRFLGYRCQNKYEFICTKCENIITVSHDEIEYDIKVAKSEINKMKALQKPIPYQSQSIALIDSGDYCAIEYSGEYITMVIDKYKNKGIDLKEIEYR